MVLFNKANSAISKEFYYFNEYTRFEGEICFLIQNKKIAGIGFGFDLTKKDIQEYLKQKGLPWERTKAFNNSAVFSEFVKFQGDIIMSGTPKGVSFYKKDDKFKAEIYIENKLIIQKEWKVI